ncbi:MAG: response regulator [Methylocystis sp.]|uniref:response regulator n=1 Tax=Methylocystis sp. TaxID=1911079 RepID=UPI003D0D73FF
MQRVLETAEVVESKRVFVVDGSDEAPAAIERMLCDTYEAHKLESATGALKKVKQVQPDLLVLAEGVIRTNGVDLIQEFLARIPEAKILVIVDQISSGFGQHCVAAGAHGFLAMPMQAERLRDKVSALLRAKTYDRQRARRRR